MKNKLLLENIACYAKNVYSKCFNLATSDDFANPRLHELNDKVINKTMKLMRKPIKRTQHFSYVSALIWRNECLNDANLLFELNVLAHIVCTKSYIVKRVSDIFESKIYRYWLMPGMDYTLPDKIKQILLEGVRC